MRLGFRQTVLRKRLKLLDRLIAKKINNNLDDILIYEEGFAQEAETLFIAFGGIVRSVKEAVAILREQGHNVGYFAPKTCMAIPRTKTARNIRMKNIFVAEMNLGQMIEPVMLAVEDKNIVKGINKANGEIISPEEIIESFMEVVKCPVK